MCHVKSLMISVARYVQLSRESFLNGGHFCFFSVMLIGKVFNLTECLETKIKKQTSKTTAEIERKQNVYKYILWGEEIKLVT